MGRTRRIGILVVLALVLGLFGAVAVGAAYIYENYSIKNIYVTGSTHYTDQEIIDMVMTDRLSHNSVYLSMQYRDRSIKNIPFLEKIDVTIVSRDTVRISVYEKAVAGYVRYLGRYLYFDRDGYVIESSMERTKGIPWVMGLHFDHAVLYQKLPVENEEVFASILDVSKLLSKYELEADRIYFDDDYRLYLYFDQVQVYIGGNDNIDEKIIALRNIIPNLDDKCGILDLHEYTGASENITFVERN